MMRPFGVVCIIIHQKLSAPPEVPKRKESLDVSLFVERLEWTQKKVVIETGYYPIIGTD